MQFPEIYLAPPTDYTRIDDPTSLSTTAKCRVVIAATLLLLNLFVLLPCVLQLDDLDSSNENKVGWSSARTCLILLSLLFDFARTIILLNMRTLRNSNRLTSGEAVASGHRRGSDQTTHLLTPAMRPPGFILRIPAAGEPLAGASADVLGDVSVGETQGETNSAQVAMQSSSNTQGDDEDTLTLDELGEGIALTAMSIV